MPFNLLSDPWIPVRLRDGSRATIRPADIPADIGTPREAVFPDWPRPDLNIATLELLIGLLQVSFAPEDTRQWHMRLGKPPTTEELDAALAPFATAFHLDGEGPRFMQDFDELQDDPNTVEALFIDSAGASTISKNADLMVKRQRYERLSLPAAAIALYALQQFAPSGGAGHRTSMRGGGPLSTFVKPPGEETPSLWRLLWSNVLTHAAFPPPDLSHPEKVFPWLAPTLTSEKGQEVHATDPRVHPLQCFFGMPRRIHLLFTSNEKGLPCDLTGETPKILVCGYITRPHGINYGHWQHPLTPCYRKKAGDPELLPMHPPAGRFSYQDWFAIVAGSTDDTREPARNIRQFREDWENGLGGGKAHVIATGWAMSNMRPLDFLYAEQPMHLARDAAHRTRLDTLAGRMVKAAELALKLSIGAVQEALKSGGKKPKADSALITARREGFFAHTENRFHELLAALSENPDADMVELARQWHDALREAALALFDEAVQPDPSDPLKARQIVDARAKLRRTLHGGKMREALALPQPART